MTITNLKKYIEEKRIVIFSINSDKKAMCLSQNKAEGIGLNYAKICNDVEEKIILAEEYSHLFHRLTYKINDILNPLRSSNISQAETRAKNNAASLLVPADELITAVQSGINEIWQLADYFEVSEEIIRTSYNHHIAKNRIPQELLPR